jgi:hypothetical protein
MHRRLQIQVFHCSLFEYVDFIKKLERCDWIVRKATLIEGIRKEIGFVCEKELG